MKKEIKMNVVGYDNIIVNTETGVISGKTYPAKDWIKRNFEAKWNKEDKVWMADPELIKEELTKNAHYYEKYIVSEDEPEEVEEEVKEESAEEIKENSAEESKGEYYENQRNRNNQKRRGNVHFDKRRKRSSKDWRHYNRRAWRNIQTRDGKESIESRQYAVNLF